MADNNTLQKILKEIQHLVKPLEFYLDPNPVEGIISLFENELNMDLNALLEASDLDVVTNSSAALLTSVRTFLNGITALSEGADFDEVFDLFPAVKRIADNIKAFEQIEIPGIGTIADKLLSYLISSYLNEHLPASYHFLSAVGLSENDNGIQEIVRISQVANFFQGPLQFIQTHYNWAQEDFKHKLFIQKIHALLYFLGIPSQLESLPELSPQTNFPIANRKLALQIPFIRLIEEASNLYTEAGLRLKAYFDQTNNHSIIALSPYGDSTLKGIIEFDNGWEITYEASFDIGAPIVIQFRNNEVNVEGPTQAPPRIGLQLGINKYLGDRTEYKKIMDFLGASLAVNKIGIGAELLAIGNEVDLIFSLETLDANFNISGESGDGFIQKLLGTKNNVIPFAIGANYSIKNGFFIDAGTHLEWLIPLHLDLGILSFNDLKISVTPSTKGIDFEVVTGIGSKLGIIYVSIDELGISGEIEIFLPGSPQEGNLGPVNFKPRFKPPSIVAASLDTGLISGGGFLSIEPEHGRYAGILALQMAAIDFSAIALITTRLPNGQPGFSMLVSINVIFFPPIQLSFGFTLVGIGGLIGINRTMNVEALRDRIATGAVNSIMFPEEPIENADRIISDLRAVFPPKPGHFVVAPFLRLGFGTPSIIEADLGLVLEFPFKARIVILGSLGIYLPVKDIAIVEIHIDVLGDFNFADRYIRIEGQLRQSHVLSIPLKGGFAFMLDWSNKPGFLFSIGGYHPRYKKPLRFPDIDRLSAIIRLGDIVVLTCEYYQAITSNSFQIGFSASLKASAAGASLEGWYGFHALLQFNPFFFSVEQGMSVKIKYKGKTLAGIAFFFRLSGPSPWTAAGYAEITILMITLKIGFEIEFGDKHDQPKTYESLPGLLDRVQESLQTPSNWSANLPANFRTGEMLRPIEEVQKEGIVLHPSGFLQVRQTALPFHCRIEKYGNSYVRERPSFSFDTTNIKIGMDDSQRRSTQTLNEHFARGQFEDLAEIEKLSTPDFELLMAGLSFGSEGKEGFDLGEEEESEQVAYAPYEEFVVDVERGIDERMIIFSDPIVDPAIQKFIGKTDIRAQKASEVSASVKYGVVDPTPLDEKEENFKLANAYDLSTATMNGTGLVFNSYSKAREYLLYQMDGSATGYQILPTNQPIAAFRTSRLLDNFAKPDNTQLIKCNKDQTLPDDTRLVFPIHLTGGTPGANQQCWMDSIQAVLNPGSGILQNLIRNIAVNFSDRSVEDDLPTVAIDYIDCNEQDCQFSVSTNERVGSVSLVISYEMQDEDFFDLRSIRGARLWIKENALPVHLSFAIYDYKGQYWSNTVTDNGYLPYPTTTTRDKVEFFFEALDSARPYGPQEPYLDQIRRIRLQIIMKLGRNRILIDRIELF